MIIESMGDRVILPKFAKTRGRLISQLQPKAIKKNFISCERVDFVIVVL